MFGRWAPPRLTLCPVNRQPAGSQFDESTIDKGLDDGDEVRRHAALEVAVAHVSGRNQQQPMRTATDKIRTDEIRILRHEDAPVVVRYRDQVSVWRLIT